MSDNQYNAQQALEMLMQSLRARNSELAGQIQAAVDAGKDVQETEPARGRRKRSRSYRKTVPYSYDEALQVAFQALRSYFVEQALVVDSVLDHMAAAVVEAPGNDYLWPGPKKRTVDADSVGKEKELNVELRTETQISQPNLEVLRLRRVEPALIEEQRMNLTRLKSLLDLEDQ